MLLEKLCRANGVSGNEKQVRDLILEELKDFKNNITIDKMGNVIVHKTGKAPKQKIMISAHMDEVGLMVTEVNDAGLVKFMKVGNFDNRALVSKRVRIGKDGKLGVIGAKPIHLQEAAERKNVIGLGSMYIDMGISDKDEAKKQAEEGAYVAYECVYKEFGDSLIKSKAIDSRSGCEILIDLIKSDIDVEFYAVFTGMNNVGFRGAGPVAYRLEPDVSIVIDSVECADFDKVKEHLINSKLGEGPSLARADMGTIYDAGLLNLINNVAKEEDIKVQFNQAVGVKTDASEIHKSKKGLKTACISIPCRYMDKPNTTIDKNDIRATRELIEKALIKLSGEVI